MNTKFYKSEKGQAIIYLVLGLVVFLGFVALAIDGGMVLSNRRNQQNAADAASLAGAAAAALHLQKNMGYTCDSGWTCGGAASVAVQNAEVRAKNRSADNGFTIDYDRSDKNGVTALCRPGSWKTGYITVTVDVSATTPANFLQLVYPKALHNVVESVSKVDPGGPLEYGNAIVALNKALCSDPGSEGIIMGGSGDINVTGGDIFSNGCMRDNGGVSVTITNGVPLGSDLSHITDRNWTPTPQYTDTQDVGDAYSVPLPAMSGGLCSDPAAHNITNTKLPNGPLSGLYCVTSSQGLSINNNETVIGTNVTIFILHGGLTINGTPHIELSAPGQNPDPAPAIPGVLIYLPPSNHSPIVINGDTTSLLTGVILAPNSSIQLNGNGNVMYDGQVIGYNVEITGNAVFKMEYHGCNGYLLPPSIFLYK